MTGSFRTFSSQEILAAVLARMDANAKRETVVMDDLATYVSPEMLPGFGIALGAFMFEVVSATFDVVTMMDPELEIGWVEVPHDVV